MCQDIHHSKAPSLTIINARNDLCNDPGAPCQEILGLALGKDIDKGDNARCQARKPPTRQLPQRTVEKKDKSEHYSAHCCL